MRKYWMRDIFQIAKAGFNLVWFGFMAYQQL